MLKPKPLLPAPMAKTSVAATWWSISPVLWSHAHHAAVALVVVTAVVASVAAFAKVAAAMVAVALSAATTLTNKKIA